MSTTDTLAASPAYCLDCGLRCTVRAPGCGSCGWTPGAPLRTLPEGQARIELGALLTITTGRLLCPLDDLYAALTTLTGAPVMTHQLPRAAEAVTPTLTAADPLLGRLAPPEDIAASPDGAEAAIKRWLADTAVVLCGYGLRIMGPAGVDRAFAIAANNYMVDALARNAGAQR